MLKSTRELMKDNKFLDDGDALLEETRNNKPVFDIGRLLLQ
jgi:hypothetical protein